MQEKVVILGASDNPERYSNKVLKLLKEHGHEVFPVHPKLKEVEGVKVYSDLSQINFPINTLTVYVNPEISSASKDQILKLETSRVIFNPGTENPDLEKDLVKKNVKVVNACSLVMLKTGQF